VALVVDETDPVLRCALENHQSCAGERDEASIGCGREIIGARDASEAGSESFSVVAFYLGIERRGSRYLGSRAVPSGKE
jgi:hypothetical protein